MAKRIILAVVGLIVLIVVVCLVKTAIFTSRQLAVKPIPVEEGNASLYASHLAEALRIKTLSNLDPAKTDPAPFKALHAFLEKTYPSVNRLCKKETVNNLSLLYKWEGTGDGKPVLLMAHQDVVSVERGSERSWTHPAFDGVIADGYVWGRGAIDCKNTMIAIMEATETLAKQGYKPKRSFYLAFGHDEEVGGLEGAGAIAALLKKRGEKLSFVIDEGGSITLGMMPGIKKPVALVGIAEKGYLTVILSAKGVGGHASTPPKNSTLGMIATALHRLEANPFSGKFIGPVRLMFENLGPEMPFGLKLVMANLWLTRPILKWQLDQSPSTAAMLHTTTAVTMAKGSDQENVLPLESRATVNLRILPGETIAGTVARVKSIIDNPAITITVQKNSTEPSRISDPDSPYYAMLNRTIREVYPDALVAPYLVLGGTDAKKFQILSENVYRFSPVPLTSDDLKTMHGTNERIAVKDFSRLVSFYIQLIKNLDQAKN